MWGIDKVIAEIKDRCWSKFDVDGIQGMLHNMKHPPMPDEVSVVEIEAEPIEEVEEPKEESAEAEKPELPESEEPEVEEPANDEEPFEDTTEEKEALEEDTPAEQDNAEEIINAIKKFYPWQDVKDILIKMVWKLMGL